jgi:CelD/BcsL family acetyltransferase involved in cellulose biosynthesis
MALRVEELASLEACNALQTPWSELAVRANTTTVFSTWEWQTTWWKHYGADNKPCIIVVREDERVVGIMPLYTRRTSLVPLVPVRELRLIGTGGDTSPDYLGPIIDPACEETVAGVLADQLVVAMRSRWDVLRLTDVAPGVFLDKLVERLKKAGIHTDPSTRNVIQIVRLPSSWKEYLAKMSGSRRWRIGNLRRGMQNKLGGSFQMELTREQLPGVIDDLITLHRKRWTSKGEGLGAFRSDAYVSFHREIITRCHEKGWIHLFRIEVGGRTVAILYCYRFKGEVLYFQTGFDPELEDHSLGQVLMGFSIETAITEGASVFDMLKGEHAYKGTWSNDVRHTVNLVSYNQSIPGRLSRLRHDFGRIKRATLRRVQGPGKHEVPRVAATSRANTSRRGSPEAAGTSESH